MRVRISLLPREFSALWRALCARRRRRHRDIRLGRTNVAQARAQRSSTKILHDSSLPIAAPAGSCQVALFESVRKLFKKSCTQIDPRVLTPITSIARTLTPSSRRSRSAFDRVCERSASRLHDLVAVTDVFRLRIRPGVCEARRRCGSHVCMSLRLRPELLRVRAPCSVGRASTIAASADGCAQCCIGRIVVGKLPNPVTHFSGSNREAGVLEGCGGAAQEV